MPATKQINKRSCVLGVFSGTYRMMCKDGMHSRGRMVLKIRCGRWDCPYCRERKAMRVKARALQGEMMAEAQKHGFRTYNLKLLTLTYGGKEKRSGSTAAQAAAEMQEGWEKLRKAIRHLFGGFHFLKVYETHKDGWPHLHVVLCGEAIAPVKVLAEITRLWRRYGFGYVKLNCRPEWSPKKCISYVLKYLFKCPVQFSKIRLFSSSEGALQRVEEQPQKQWEESHLHWIGSQEGHLAASRLLRDLGESEILIEAEVFPVKGCPF